MGALELFIQNQSITPFTILKLSNYIEISVWPYLSHIWANPIAIRTGANGRIFYRKGQITNKNGSSPKWNTTVATFLLILRFNYNRLSLLIITVLILTSVQELYQALIAK